MVRTRAGDLLAVGSRVGPQLTSSILSSDIKKFQAYLSERSASVISALEELFARQPWSPPEPTQLQQLLDKTLAAERDHIQKLQQVNNEKEQLAGRLENATERYLKAEKKLDRSKSVAVAAIDRQGQLQSHLAPPEQSTATVNGDSKAASPEATAAAVQEAEEAKMEAEAVAKKRKEQLEMLESENKKLTEQITSLTSQLSNLSDDDYAKTELFRVAKSQHEDLIKRIEHLEATNVQLREEAKKLQAERTAYRAQMEDESSVAVKESEGDLAKAESNEQRLRAERDATQSRMAILENSRSEHKVTINKLQELVDARDSRIQDLEAEISQLETQLRETDIDAETGLDDISIDELKTKLITVQKERALLQQETTHMETALKKFQGLAVKKVDEFRSFEDRIGQLQAEKSKAEQKYFGAMKAKDARILERDALATQNKKTSSLIAAFKEAIAKLEENVRLLEKQIAEQRDAIESLTYQQQTEHQKMSQAEFTSAQKESHIQELQKSLQGKDASVSTAQQLQREAEVEVEKLKVSLVEAKKKAEEWRNKARSNPSDEVEMLMVGSDPYPCLIKELTVSAACRLLHLLQPQPQRHDVKDLRARHVPRMR